MCRESCDLIASRHIPGHANLQEIVAFEQRRPNIQSSRRCGPRTRGAKRCAHLRERTAGCFGFTVYRRLPNIRPSLRLR